MNTLMPKLEDFLSEPWPVELECPVEMMPLVSAITLKPCLHVINRTALALLSKKADSKNPKRVYIFCPLCRIQVLAHEPHRLMRQKVEEMLTIYLSKQHPLPSGSSVASDLLAKANAGETCFAYSPIPTFLDEDISFAGLATKEPDLYCVNLISYSDESAIVSIDIIQHQKELKTGILFRSPDHARQFIHFLDLDHGHLEGQALSCSDQRNNRIILTWLLAHATVLEEYKKDIQRLRTSLNPLLSFFQKLLRL